MSNDNCGDYIVVGQPGRVDGYRGHRVDASDHRPVRACTGMAGQLSEYPGERGRIA